MIKNFKCMIPGCKKYFFLKRSISVMMQIKSIKPGYEVLSYHLCRKCYKEYSSGKLFKLIKEEIQKIEEIWYRDFLAHRNKDYKND